MADETPITGNDAGSEDEIPVSVISSEVAPAPVAEDDDSVPAVAPEVAPEAVPEDAEAMPASGEPMNLDDEEFKFDKSVIDFRGANADLLRNLLTEAEKRDGPDIFAARVKDTTTWEHQVARTLIDIELEEIRTQDGLKAVIAADGKIPTEYFIDTATGKKLLAMSPLKGNAVPGVVTKPKPEEAFLAFETQLKGAVKRVPLYNSCITADIISPTPAAVDTLIANCLAVDQELGAAQGFQYFSYWDILFKDAVVNFVIDHIVGSNYNTWNKRESLISIIKVPDFHNLVMSLASVMWKNGFPDFKIACYRPLSDSHPAGCNHVEKVNVDISSMILTRFSALPEEVITFMSEARFAKKMSNRTEILNMQAKLGLEDQSIHIGNREYFMRVPTLKDYLDAGTSFIGAIATEIQGDNIEGRRRQMSKRFIRTFLPWISRVRQYADDGTILETDDVLTITRAMEKTELEVGDEFRNKLTDYVNISQLTYIGYPSIPCPACGWTTETPSGLMTFDPFSAFFTLADQYAAKVS